MKVTLSPTEWVGNSGDAVEITCSSPESTRLIWSREGNVPLPISSSQQSGVLKIRNPSPSDSGTYICTAISYEGLETSQTAKIAIVQRPQVPNVQIQPEIQTVPQGTNTELKCITSGEPGMHFKWSKHGETSLGPNAQEFGDTLKFRNIQVQDRGIYICRVSNSRSSYEASAMIEVER